MSRPVFRRNRSGFLLGASWSHYRGWPQRQTHFYLGWWVLSVTTRGSAAPETPKGEG